MNKVKAFIERGNDGTYGIYVDLEDHTLNYGIHGDGRSVEEAIEDFKAGYLEMKALYKEEGKPFAEAEFEFLNDRPCRSSFPSTAVSSKAPRSAQAPAHAM